MRRGIENLEISLIIKDIKLSLFLVQLVKIYFSARLWRVVSHLRDGRQLSMELELNSPIKGGAGCF